jgi:uncharacterized RDD family membrane protein YckC
VIKTCQSCGAVNGEPDDICCSCDAPLGVRGRSPASRQVATQTEANVAIEPEWRREVSNKLRQYRARRRGVSAELQTVLPFEPDPPRQHRDPAAEFSEIFAPAPEKPSPEKSVREPRKRRSERFEIAIPELEFAPSIANISVDDPVSVVEGLTNIEMYPVASLPERRLAALVDVGLLLFTYGGMLALFTVLGGHVGMNKLDLTVAVATLALFYAQYFALFTVFGGSTPGMMVQGLHVVSFKGQTPTSRQLAWRSLGYLISAGSCFLGFIWALWDDDQLCWQDRISHTYLTWNEGDTPS